jgi:hydrogenase nickel incorporation protein HypB
MEIKVVKKVLDVNDTIAENTRESLRAQGIYLLNMMSAPGSGKTTILEKTLASINQEAKTGVIVGDIATTNDSDRLAATGVPVVQINTEPFGGDCHLTANVVREGLNQLDLKGLELVIVENLGNLVCPAEFDIGQDSRAVVLSVTEGEDKPVKYPLMFRISQVALINKIDLVPHLEVDMELYRKNIKAINPDMKIFEISARTGQGLEQWVEWLKTDVRAKKA